MSLCVSAALVIGLGIEIGPKNDWHHYGREPTGMARLECQLDEKWGLDYTHYSSLLDGAPFGGKDQNTSDVVSVTYRFKLK